MTNGEGMNDDERTLRAEFDKLRARSRTWAEQFARVLDARLHRRWLLEESLCGGPRPEPLPSRDDVMAAVAAGDLYVAAIHQTRTHFERDGADFLGVWPTVEEAEREIRTRFP